MTVDTSELVTRLQAALGPQYRIESELGRGGMGLVFLATDTTLDRPVAVKVMHPDLSIHPTIIQRFLAEARMIAKLRHPNIVQVHTAGEATGLFYYVMDHVPGETLRQRLLRDGRLPAAEVGRIIGDIADALAAAGRAGLVHRDVKPENVLLDSSTGRAMLADFGIARVAEADVSGSLTGQGVAVGTPSYMSPEQATGETVDHRSDLYSLGVVAYELLAGVPPFRAATGAAVISMQLSEQPAPIGRVRDGIPPHMAGAIMKALAKAPAERWQDGEAFRRALHGEGPVVAARRPRRRWIAFAAAGVVLAAAATVALALTGGDGPPRGVNPRQSMLILPFNNLRDDQSLDWLREGSVNMLTLNLSQWTDLSVVDHDYLHDLLARHDLAAADVVGLDMARRLARDAGKWTVVLGDFDRSGDSLHLVARVYDVATGRRVDLVRADGLSGPDVRPLFDMLAARLLDLSGAPEELRAGVSRLTTTSLAAYRSYLRGIDFLAQWELADAERELQAAIAEDTTFGLAYYKLSLTRGWRVGAADSIGRQAIEAATRYSDRLPAHDQTVIKAYRAFTDGDFVSSQSLYRSLLSRDSSDADAWYGLADALFHDTARTALARNRTDSYRAFDRVLRLDPGYTLAYDHVMDMLIRASYPRPGDGLALITPDSFVPWVAAGGRRLMDSVPLSLAVARARALGVARGRGWVANQPNAVRSHAKLVDALMASREFPAALEETRRVRAIPAAANRGDLAFLEGRVHFAAGDYDLAASAFGRALDTLPSTDFSEAPAAATTDIRSAASVFAYLGQLDRAAAAIRVSDSVGRELHPQMYTTAIDYLTGMLADLYGAAGGPAREMRRLWARTAEAARVAPAEQRGEVALRGAGAAIGLFVAPAGDAGPLREFEALTRSPLPREVRALVALQEGDSAAARRLLTEPDSTEPGQKEWRIDPRPFAAQAWYLLGDYQRTIDALRDFQPEMFSTHGFDSRWAMLGRIRLTRAYAYEKLGRRDLAAGEYRAVLAQWRNADAVLAPFRRQAEEGLARTTGAG